MESVLRTVEELTSEWLGEALGRELEITGIETIGTGQMSKSHRVTFADGDTVVVKLAATDENSRGTGVGMGAYLREVSFYQQLAPRIGGPLAACHYAAYDQAAGWFTLVLEDIRGAVQGDQIAGCSREEGEVAVRALARLHGPVLGDLHAGSLDFLNLPNPLTQQLASALLPGFLERYGDRVKPEHAEVCERFVSVLDIWSADQRPPLGLVHGDYRLDNMLFADGECTVVDWQTCMWGPALYDLSYFMAGAFDPADRRAFEQDLVRLYQEELVAQNVHTLTYEQCWEEYRRQCFGGLLMTIVASMVVERTDRGDDMFMTWMGRNAQQVLDLGALDLLPEPGAKPPALQPIAEDEGRHAPGAEESWNESWYFDAVSDDGTLGVYSRLGRVPNLDLALFTASIVGPDRDSIMVVRADAPLPDIEDDEQRIAVDGLTVTQHCEDPLKQFRVRLAGTGEVFADQSAPLRGEAGEPVDVTFDLVWETTGIPFQWRQSTRYEIPCRISGTIRIGDEEIAFSGIGQRDHSWGARDWFATDWMWNAFHLDDGTHTHAVGLPQMPGMGIGYVQRGAEIAELESLNQTAEVADNGLITAATTDSEPDALHLDIEPVAFGAIRLEAPDGRISHFPRAMARVVASDGRAGVGWIEWNRNQR